MLKMEIAFDEEKVEREGKYDIEKMYAVVDKYFLDKKLNKIGKGLYIDRGHKDDYAKMLLFASYFKKEKWFMNNIKVWNFHKKPPQKYQKFFCVI
jgi:hypothetical protein